MGNIYTVSAVGNLIVGKKWSEGEFEDTWDMRRAYMRFDISSLGIVNLDDIIFVKLNFKVQTILGFGDNVKLTSGKSSTSNWGTALTATESDFISTQTVEVTQLVNGTGWQTFNIDKNNLDLSGWLWLRLKWDIEGDGTTQSLSIYSQNATSQKDRPYLEIKLKNRHNSVIIYG